MKLTRVESAAELLSLMQHPLIVAQRIGFSLLSLANSDSGPTMGGIFTLKGDLLLLRRGGFGGGGGGGGGSCWRAALTRLAAFSALFAFATCICILAALVFP